VYETLTRIAGGVVRPWQLSNDERMRPTLAGLQHAVTDDTRLVVLASPGNPTGAAADPAEWARIGEWLDRVGLPWLSDEIYVPLQSSGGHPSMLAHSANGLVAAGLSKTHALAGWRVGWLIVPEALQPALAALHQQLVTSTPSLTQQAAIAAFEAAGQVEVRELVRMLDARRERVVAGLLRCGFEVVSGDAGLFVWTRPPAGYDDDLQLASRLMHEARVVLIPGRAFGDAGRGYLRVSIGVRDDAIDDALERLRRWTTAEGWSSRSS
jgi:aspartate/methionine/tyrosine aminotransferase